jgi:hypothetical protein
VLLIFTATAIIAVAIAAVAIAAVAIAAVAMAYNQEVFHILNIHYFVFGFY